MYIWPLTPNIDRVARLFLKFNRATWTLTTCPKRYMGRGHLSNSTGDKGNFKRQRHATFPFLKVDMRHQDPLVKGPLYRPTGTLKLSHLPGHHTFPIIYFCKMK